MRISFSVWFRSLRQLLQTAVFLTLIAGSPAPLLAQTTPADFKAALSGWQAALEKAAGRLSRGNLEEAEYETLRADLSSLFDNAREASADAANELGITQQLADAL